MGRYIQRRLLISVPVLLAVTVIIFGLLHITPGDPLDTYAPPDRPMPEAQREALRERLGLHRPVPVQYVFWLREAATGNLGFRAKNMRPVSESIAAHIGPTLLLMATGMAIGIIGGILLGIVAAVRQYSILDMLLTIFAFLGISTPAYLAGLLGLFLFSLQFGLFPSGGFSTPGEPFSVLDHLHHLILPATILSLNYVAMIMRYTRSSLLEVLAQDYVRTARSKGLKERVVTGTHAMRNALLPVVTIIGASIPNLLGGAVFIESIFSWPGMGRLFIDGVESRDFPLIMGLTLILAAAVLIANLLTDVAYAFIDPRIRYE